MGSLTEPAKSIPRKIPSSLFEPAAPYNDYSASIFSIDWCVCFQNRNHRGYAMAIQTEFIDFIVNISAIRASIDFAVPG